MTTRALAVTLLLGGVVGASACAGPFGPCGGIACVPCDDSVAVHVKNARTELPVETATAREGDRSCDCSAGSCSCSVRAIGPHQITVSANGYQSATATIIVPDPPPEACCVCPEPSPRQQTVLLVPL